MRVVIDTNVITYYLLRTEPFYQEARDLWHWVEDPVAPSFWAAELANALWGVTRAGALSRALAANHPVYDTLFVELAERRSLPLATFDQKLIKLFPRVAVRPRELG